ncbi:MAG: trigger factor [Planctomycetes bacterium]|nr:trigger factor [Planctomycetota bacterium]
MVRKQGPRSEDQAISNQKKASDAQKSHDTHHSHDHGAADPKHKARVTKDAATAKTETVVHEHAHEHAPTAAAGAPERGEQKVTIEDIGPARKRLTIEVPAERITKKIEGNYGKLRDDAVLPGFRRGRAPQRLLEKRFATSIRDEVRGQLITESYTQAVEDEKLDVIGDPDVKDADKLKLPETGAFTYQVEVEVSPKVELPPLEGIEVKKPAKGVTDADIDTEVDRLRTQHGQMKDVPGAVVEAKDFVQADVKILPQGADAAAEPLHHEAATYIFVTGEDQKFKGQVLGIVVDDLGKLLIGKKAGDAVTITTTGPATHENEKIKGQPITIAIRLDKVERVTAAPVEDLVKGLGLETVVEMRERIQKMLDSRRQREQQTAMHRQVCDHLLAKVDLTLPKGLTGRQTERLLHRRAMELAYQGMANEEVKQKIAEMRASSEEEAGKQLKLFFILDQAAKLLEVEVSEAEINGRIAMLAMQEGRRPEKLRQQLQRNGEIEHLYLQVREQKTLDKVLEKAKIVDVDEAPAKA